MTHHTVQLDVTGTTEQAALTLAASQLAAFLTITPPQALDIIRDHGTTTATADSWTMGGDVTSWRIVGEVDLDAWRTTTTPDRTTGPHPPRVASHTEP